MKINLKNTMVALVMVFSTLALSAQTFTVKVTEPFTGEVLEATFNGHVSYHLEVMYANGGKHYFLTETLNDYDERENATFEYSVRSEPRWSGDFLVFDAEDDLFGDSISIKINEKRGIVEKVDDLGYKTVITGEIMYSVED